MIAIIGEGQKVAVESNSRCGTSVSCLGGSCRGEIAVQIVASGDHFFTNSSSGDDVVSATSSFLGTPRLPLYDSFRSSLNNQCRFSFKRTRLGVSSSVNRHKRRKIELEEKSVGLTSSVHDIEVKVPGLNIQDLHDYKKTAQQSSVSEVVDNELTHICPPEGSKDSEGTTEQGKESKSLMLPGTSPLYGDIKHEEGLLTRPASLPNLPHEELRITRSSSELSHEAQSAKDISRYIPLHDEGNDAVMSSASNPDASMFPLNCGCNKEEPDDVPSEVHHGEARGSSWEFKVVASIKTQNQNLTSTDIIGTIAFEKTHEYFATGGIARKIRVYAYSPLVSGLSSADEDEDDDEEESVEYLKQRRLRKWRASAIDIDHARCCVQEVCTPAKLSSLQWHQERPNVIACGDYDGVVAEWDVERMCAICERDENGGQRIWSIDYSKDFPDLIASASDDGTVRMWDQSSEQSVAIIFHSTFSPICCAEFGPASSSLIALASADSNVYLYDTRWLSTPLLTLAHHKRATSYVRFLDSHRLVSSSIDSSVKLWDVQSMSCSSCRTAPVASQRCNAPVKSFDSHYNVRNFTGLSVRGEDGLIACGSETNQAFVYDSQKCSPILSHSFDYYNPAVLRLNTIGSSWSADRLVSKGNSEFSEDDSSNSLIVSAVCWRAKPDDCTLVAANSDGVLRLLSGNRC
ncbi:protein SPA1-RELATED 3 [Physcomitrium patens]|uniref:Uncharacterized protein n=1 Tax=Physcomitrium patens TaxID=3218 RepID=A0A2K1L3I5_PHYPA|nr:protein SPA1-RELATED 3-like [Physcomitrium patens]PNR60585.1 hypothetical protein PHYPA_003378 [Physcomitrium patens]|eukprot:XP_024398878.1 protein SPA1-RELATED 3-like [Physcomitrella patens]